MNGIKYITNEELEILRKNVSDKCHFVIIDGEKHRNWDQYIKTIVDVYQFPKDFKHFNYDGYQDWMEDLEWLGKDEYILCITNYRSFLCEERKIKEMVMDLFIDNILPWWDSEVEKYCGGYEKKSFQIFLIL